MKMTYFGEWSKWGLYFEQFIQNCVHKIINVLKIFGTISKYVPLAFYSTFKIENRVKIDQIVGFLRGVCVQNHSIYVSFITVR